MLGIVIGSTRCLLLLWLVEVIALVLVFRQSFENCSNEYKHWNTNCKKPIYQQSFDHYELPLISARDKNGWNKRMRTRNSEDAWHRRNAENRTTEIRDNLLLSFPRNVKSCSYDARGKNRNTAWQNASDEERGHSREVVVAFGNRYLEIPKGSVLGNAFWRKSAY